MCQNRPSEKSSIGMFFILVGAVVEAVVGAVIGAVVGAVVWIVRFSN